MIYGLMKRIFPETIVTIQRATTDDIQIAFNEQSRMTPDTRAYCECAMSYKLIQYNIAGTIGTSERTIIDDILFTFNERQVNQIQVNTVSVS